MLPSSQDEIFSVESNMNAVRFNNAVPTSENSIGPSIRIPSPGNPSAYFAPISPAAKTTNVDQLENLNASKNSLMEMLCSGSRLNEGNNTDVNTNRIIYIKIDLAIISILI